LAPRPPPRHACRRAERIGPEWWNGDRDPAVRNDYRVKDADGRRYWLYRAGLQPPAASASPTLLTNATASIPYA